MLYEFKLGINAAEATKTICCAECDGAVDYSNQVVQEISFGLEIPQWSSNIK